MKTEYFIPVIIAVLVLCATACSGGNVEAPEYTPVTIAGLIGNSTAYNNEKVSVSGRYVDFAHRPPPQCPPQLGCSTVTQQLETYALYPTTWGIADGDGEIGVLVIHDMGTLVHTLPNYEEGEMITLKGTSIATTTPGRCNSTTQYRSLYIAVDAKDIDITIDE